MGVSWRRKLVPGSRSCQGSSIRSFRPPFGGFASQHLTATVSNLGGLGSLGVVSLNESAIRDAVVEMLSLTNKPFAVNLWVSTSDPQLAFINHDTAAKKIVELAQYYAELGVEAPSVPQVVAKNFKAQCYAAINAGAPVLSFVYGIPPSEIVACMHSVPWRRRSG
jgi:nitronate monooxygenase